MPSARLRRRRCTIWRRPYCPAAPSHARQARAGAPADALVAGAGVPGISTKGVEDIAAHVRPSPSPGAEGARTPWRSASGGILAGVTRIFAVTARDMDALGMFDGLGDSLRVLRQVGEGHGRSGHGPPSSSEYVPKSKLGRDLANPTREPMEPTADYHHRPPNCGTDCGGRESRCARAPSARGAERRPVKAVSRPSTARGRPGPGPILLACRRSRRQLGRARPAAVAVAPRTGTPGAMAA